MSEVFIPQEPRVGWTNAALKPGHPVLLDLVNLVRDLRSLSVERARLRPRGGSATSEGRRERRRERRALAERIREKEREIVAWALVVVPIERKSEDA